MYIAMALNSNCRVSTLETPKADRIERKLRSLVDQLGDPPSDPLTSPAASTQVLAYAYQPASSGRRHEVTDYFSMGNVITAENTTPRDILRWWKAHCNRFPRLSLLAQKYHCIQASSVASERVFSQVRDVIDLKRTRLKPDIVRGLMILNEELRQSPSNTVIQDSDWSDSDDEY